MLISHEIQGNSPGPHLLITGGVHGDEFESMAAIRQLITEIQPAELRGRVTLVPVVNEPAFALGQRAGDDGLDLARTCPGRADGSMTERIAFALSALIRTADLYIDLHTGGTRLMVTPLNGYVLHRDERVLNQQRRMARAFGLPLIWGTDPTLPGRSLSVARDANVPAIYAEYLGGRFDPLGVQAYVTGCLNVMREFDLLPKSAASVPASEPWIVEDARPGSGHMQVNHPSPCAGFFQPLVDLGQVVQEGNVLGAVSDPLGQHVATIRARYTGTVIVLHTFPCVAAGTGVAVILDSVSPSPGNP